eukprot:IDg15351t1
MNYLRSRLPVPLYRRIMSRTAALPRFRIGYRNGVNQPLALARSESKCTAFYPPSTLRNRHLRYAAFLVQMHTVRRRRRVDSSAPHIVREPAVESLPPAAHHNTD